MKKVITIAQVLIALGLLGLVATKIFDLKRNSPSLKIERAVLLRNDVLRETREKNVPISTAKNAIPKEVDDYFQALKDFEEKKVTLEKVYQSGNLAMTALGEVLNDLNEQDLQSAKDHMPGYFLNPNTETVLINPEPGYFLKLASSSQDPADPAFFKAFKETYPEGLSPAYTMIEPETSGCTVYDGTLVKLFKQWQAFAGLYPHQYQEEANRKLLNIVDELADDQCACDGKEKVVRELKNFLEIPSSLKAKERVALKLKNIESGKAEIRFNCPLSH